MRILKSIWILVIFSFFSCSEESEITKGFDENSNQLEIFCQSGVSLFELNSINKIENFINYLSVTPNCNNFIGDIIISDISLDSDEYKSLQFLKQLKVIDGSLTIKNVKNLNGLDGLSNLEKISGSLIINMNTDLKSINSLLNLKTIDGSIVIQSNNNLENLDGLLNIEEVETLIVDDNSLLKNLDGLSNLKKIKGYFMSGNHLGLIISKNRKLENLKGLSSLTKLGSLRVNENDLLQNLDGLENVNGLFSIDLNDNKSITNIDAFSNVKDLGYLSIKNNQNLRNFEGLNNLETINEVFYLENITADFESNLFPNFKSVNDLQLKDIFNTKDTFSSFNNLISLKQLSIKAISSNVLAGFDKLTEINLISIAGNSFKEISGFKSFSSGKIFILEENKDLELISGFNSINEITSLFSIKNNSKLSNCSIESFCNYLKKGGIITFENNAGKCNNSQDVLDNCN